MRQQGDGNNSILERIPELACPTCKGGLEVRCNFLHCARDGVDYPIQGLFADMLVGDHREFQEEIDVQDRVAEEYEDKRYRDPYARRYHEWWTNQMIVHIPQEGRILDNGCGIGLLGMALPKARIVALDISRQMVRRAATHSDAVVVGNSQQLPFRASSFDAVFCRSLLHHLPQPQLAVAEMHRVLKPGGRIVLADTNASLLSNLPRRIIYRGKHFSEDHKNLTRRDIEAFLAPHFEVSHIQYFGYIAYPLVGFPDLVSVFRYVPAKNFCYRTLMLIDAVLSRIPIIRRLAWGILIGANRR